MSDYTHWHAGMKVVCIGKRPANVEADAVYPVVGEVYTIRELRDDAPRGRDGIVVLLMEISNTHFIGKTTPGGHAYLEPGFDPNGFRPVQTQKTDISIFEAMLTGAKEREPA